MPMTGCGRFDLSEPEGIEMMGGHSPPPIESWTQCDGYFRMYLKRVTELYGENAARDLLLLAHHQEDWPEFDAWSSENTRRNTLAANKTYKQTNPGKQEDQQ